MLSETVHSFVDTLNELLLLYGFHRAGRRPDLVHPLGYGREIYFWSFIVALMIFALGSGVSIYQGIAHVRHHHPGAFGEWTPCSLLDRPHGREKFLTVGN